MTYYLLPLCLLPITYLPISYCRLPSPYYLLLLTYCPFSVSLPFYLLPIIYPPLLITYYLLPIVCLPITYYLFNVLRHMFYGPTLGSTAQALRAASGGVGLSGGKAGGESGARALGPRVGQKDFWTHHGSHSTGPPRRRKERNRVGPKIP